MTLLAPPISNHPIRQDDHILGVGFAVDDDASKPIALDLGYTHLFSAFILPQALYTMRLPSQAQSAEKGCKRLNMSQILVMLIFLSGREEVSHSQVKSSREKLASVLVMLY
jgi:hypothetical protein